MIAKRQGMNCRKGFTLIELLVVIAIIAILAAILFPVFAAAKERGRIASCSSNLKQVVTAVHGYVDDWGGRLPKVEYFGRVWYLLQVGPDPKGPYLQDVLAPYNRSAKVWLCPSLKPSQYFSRNPDASPAYDFSKHQVSENCGTSSFGVGAPTNYMWIHLRFSNEKGDVDTYHSMVSGVMESTMKQPTRVITLMEFPYWARSPHAVWDDKGFHIADSVAYYDGHVTLTKFPDHAWAETWRGWE